jgi:hypothetical protein
MIHPGKLMRRHEPPFPLRRTRACSALGPSILSNRTESVLKDYDDFGHVRHVSSTIALGLALSSLICWMGIRSNVDRVLPVYSIPDYLLSQILIHVEISPLVGSCCSVSQRSHGHKPPAHAPMA